MVNDSYKIQHNHVIENKWKGFAIECCLILDSLYQFERNWKELWRNQLIYLLLFGKFWKFFLEKVDKMPSRSSHGNGYHMAAI